MGQLEPMELMKFMRPIGLINSKLRRAALLLLILALGLAALDRIFPAELTAEVQARVVVAADGQPLRAFADAEGVWRYPIQLDQVSPRYLQALIQYEDRWYYRHCGINPFALLRAGWQWLTSGGIVSGGSTLTMQVARLRFGLKTGVADKLVQMLRALQLELHYGKTEILEYYLNHAPFGGPLEGVEAASRSYFGYSAADLTQAQAALLAVLPQSPSRFRPDRYPERAQRMRDKVLRRLAKFGVLTPEQVADAMLEPVVAALPSFAMAAPLLAQRLFWEYPETSLIQTFIDRDLQLTLEQIAADRLHLLPEKASLAMLVMEHGSGRVVGYVGSAKLLDEDRFGHVDMVMAERSPGSTLKPFIYGLALDEGLIHSESLLMDVPLRFGDYRPKNFNRGFSGPVSVSEALQESLNLPAVQILEQLGPDRFYAQMQTAGAGLHLPVDAKPNLAMALGGVATDLEHLVALYAALANGGKALPPRLTPESPLRRRKLLSPGAAWIIRDLLTRREQISGADSGLAIKTGTSFGQRDAWALAVAPHHTIGVWVGRPDNAAMVGHYGNATAVPILQAVARVLPTTAYGSHPRPDTVSRQRICWPGGQASETLCDEERRAWILEQTAPRTLMATRQQTPLIPIPEIEFEVAADSGLRVPLGCVTQRRKRLLPIWPAALQQWIKPQWRTSQRIPPLDPRCRLSAGLLAEAPVRIVGLPHQARIKRHASTREQPLISVDAVGGQPNWYWFLNGELLPEGGSHLDLRLDLPGEYQLAVSDQAGMSDRISFVIEP
jgi:penicillin-binding protein 1C